MNGLMMDTPLLISSLIEHAARCHGDTEIVSRTVEGPIHRYDYARCHARVCRLANALRALGVEDGHRVGTLAWNGYRHLELYYAVSGIGAVCHTVNPRLFVDQIRYIVQHAGDRVVFVDLSFVELAQALAPQLPEVAAWVVMTDAAHMPQATLPGALCYEALLDAASNTIEWPQLDERHASALCYTSGTTGEPKGTLYNHRSTVLHAFSLCSANSALPLSCRESVLPVVPMFHVHAWGIPYAAVMAGARIVFPGPRLDGESLHELLEAERVTITAGVPTVWFDLLEFLEHSGKRLDHLKLVTVGGSAAPLSMLRTFEDRYGITAYHAWGMTEMSPVGTTGMLKPKVDALAPAARDAVQRKQGRAIYGVEMKIVDESGRELPRDGQARGELLVRGPWIASAYYEDADASAAAFTTDGWFRTGDVATLDADGCMQIVDRSKDLIKSGGEWISSIDLENAAVAHPDIAEAAAIAMPDAKWGERPLLVLVRRDGARVAGEEVVEWLAQRVAKWWLPERVEFVAELPHTATGKISKAELRRRFAAG
jgi:fatty-acyl-CoA synthase